MNSILFIAGAEGFGGAERQLAVLARGLRARGHRVTVAVCFPQDSLFVDTIGTDVRIVNLDRRGRGGIAGFVLRAIRLLQHEQPQVIHGYLNGPNLLALLLRPFYRRARVVWGVRASNLDLSQYEWRHRFSFRVNSWLSHFPKLIICNSWAGADYHRERGFAHARLVVVPNGVDTGQFRIDPGVGQVMRQRWGIKAGDVLIGLIANLLPAKDHPTFIRAMQILAGARSNLYAVCVGDGPPEHRRRLERLCSELQISNRVLWTGKHNDMPAVYNALDVTCSSSTTEGFPNVVAEAMACGVPCVVTDVGDSARIVGDTGVVVPPGDSAALASGLDRLLSNLSQARKDRCRERIQKNFSVTQLIAQTETLLWSDA